MNYRQQVPCEKCGAKRPETRPLVVFPAGTIDKLWRPARIALSMGAATVGFGLLGHAAHVQGFSFGASIGGGIVLLLRAVTIAIILIDDATSSRKGTP